jgi:DNA-binding NtrC family response regulator
MSKDKVLIVVGEETVRISLCEFLEAKGFATGTAQSCEEGERQSRTFLPDVAILAGSLPDGGASDLMLRLRAVHSSIPIIILTGPVSVDLAVQAIKQGADQILPKPVDLPTLLVLVQRLIESRRNQRRRFAEQASHANDRTYPFLGNSPAIRRLSDLANKIAAADDSLLIMGEPGTEKGLLVRWVHDHSA